MMDSLFHTGELEVQRQLGSQVNLAQAQRLLQAQVPLQAGAFIQLQRCLYITLPHPSSPGVITLPLWGQEHLELANPKTLVIHLDRIHSQLNLNVLTQLQPPQGIGILLLESITRRRLRINGHLISIDSTQLKIQVDQCYPNCPKYIQPRLLEYLPSPQTLSPIDSFDLNQDMYSLIQSSDTGYVGSQSLEGDLDTSHRGGEPGFIQVLHSQAIRIYELPGNGIYNSLGNFKLNPEACLLIIDYHQSRTLQIRGRVELYLDPLVDTGAPYWELNIHHVTLTDLDIQIQATTLTTQSQ